MIFQLSFRVEQLPKALCTQDAGMPREGINITRWQTLTLEEPLQGQCCVRLGCPLKHPQMMAKPAFAGARSQCMWPSVYAKGTCKPCTATNVPIASLQVMKEGQKL